MTAPRTVICMKWGTLYSAAYVNVLYSACRAHITGDFRFVCLTDDAEGLLPEVEHFPIPDMGLSEFDWKKGGWAKLSVFKPELYDITGRCLFLDLDSVVTGSLDEMFDYPGDVVVIDSSENWRGETGGGAFGDDVGVCLHRGPARRGLRAVHGRSRRDGVEVPD